MIRTRAFRWTAWIAGAMALALVAAWVWWRESDTGERWRFENAMKTYCGGLLAYEESPLFEGLWPGLELPGDRALGPDAHSCRLADRRLTVTVAHLFADPADEGQLRELLPPLGYEQFPVPLPGGWHGAADGDMVRVLLGCRGGADSVSVVVEAYNRTSDSDRKEARRETGSAWLDGDLYWARFATATAAKAAARWGCETEAGKPLKKLPELAGDKTIVYADGACAGLPFARDKRLDTVRETLADANTLFDTCEVGASAYFDDRYTFSARFGAYAAWDRRKGSVANGGGLAGATDHSLWASARCPGGGAGRTLFTGFIPPKAATVWRPGEKGEETFGLPAFREFAKRSAERHGCTDLRLPAAGR
ncbi:hypothetical protein ACGFRB_16760 [Streptomyces sp. NPDC048718]|uniref:hypothetical protein n=1 Tax=Streptomyces sp. NPDC048718 TaxID=3365587 RepID=UPI00372183BA